MLRFIFGKKDNKPSVNTETQRQSFERVMAELNTLLAEQPVKPSISVDLANGQLRLDLPEQLADEALALPAPVEDTQDEPDAPQDEAAADKTADDKPA